MSSSSSSLNHGKGKDVGGKFGKGKGKANNSGSAESRSCETEARTEDLPLIDQVEDLISAYHRRVLQEGARAPLVATESFLRRLELLCKAERKEGPIGADAKRRKAMLNFSQSEVIMEEDKFWRWLALCLDESIDIADLWFGGYTGGDWNLVTPKVALEMIRTERLKKENATIVVKVILPWHPMGTIPHLQWKYAFGDNSYTGVKQSMCIGIVEHLSAHQ